MAFPVMSGLPYTKYSLLCLIPLHKNTSSPASHKRGESRSSAFHMPFLFPRTQSHAPGHSTVIQAKAQDRRKPFCERRVAAGQEEQCLEGKECPMLEVWDFGEPGRMVAVFGLLKVDRE